MRDVLVAANKDIRRFLRDPAALALWLGIPLLIGGLLLLVMGGNQGPRPRVHLLIADEDDSFGSRLLVGAFGQEGAGEIFHTEKVDQETGRRRLDDGEASALLVIPERFAEAVLDEEPTRLVLVTNPAQRIMPGLAEEMLSVLSDGVFYAHRLLGPQIREIVKGPPDGNNFFANAQIAQMSISMNQTIRRLQRYLDGPAIRLETAAVEQPSRPAPPGVPFAFYFLPGILVMGLLFAAQGFGDDIWREREAGVLRRAMTTPLGAWRLLAGKMLAVAAILAAILLIMLWAGMSYFDLPLVRLPLALVWSTGIGLLLTAMMLAIQMFASSHRGASVLSYLVVFPLMMLGGSMFPFEIMPPWLAAVGRFTPNGWALQQLKAILLARDGPMPLVAAVALLLLTTAGLLWIAGVRLSRRFARC